MLVGHALGLWCVVLVPCLFGARFCVLLRRSRVRSMVRARPILCAVFLAIAACEIGVVHLLNMRLLLCDQSLFSILCVSGFKDDDVRDQVGTEKLFYLMGHGSLVIA